MRACGFLFSLWVGGVGDATAAAGTVGASPTLWRVAEARGGGNRYEMAASAGTVYELQTVPGAGVWPLTR